MSHFFWARLAWVAFFWIVGGLAQGNAQPPSSSPTKASAADSASTAEKGEMLLTPFGELTWNDTFLEALTKVRRLRGPTETTVFLLQRQIPAEEVEGKNRLSAWLGAIIAQNDAYRREFLQTDPLLSRPIYRVSLTNQIGFDAKPLSVAGVSYMLQVRFRNERGLALVDPPRVARQTAEFFGNDASQHVPLVLSEVWLLPAGGITPEAHREIAASLRKKYEPLHKPTPGGNPLNVDYAVLTFEDQKGNTLRLYPGGRLHYRNGQVYGEHSLEKVYQQRLAEWREAQRRQEAAQASDALDDL